MAAALRRVCSDPTLRATLRRGALQTAGRYSEAVMTEAYLRLYAEVIA